MLVCFEGEKGRLIFIYRLPVVDFKSTSNCTGSTSDLHLLLLLQNGSACRCQTALAVAGGLEWGYDPGVYRLQC